MILLDNKKLQTIFIKFKKNKLDNEATEELCALLKPVITLTVARYDAKEGDDIEQEILITVLKKITYLTDAFLSGRIKDPTSYFFRFINNSALAHIVAVIGIEIIGFCIIKQAS